jgi:hypothetical protein
MILKYLSNSIFMLLVLGSSLFAQDYEMSKIEQKAKIKYLTDDTKKEYRYRDDTSIESGDLIDGNVIVVKGHLSVYGTIEGDVLVLYGDIKVKENGLIKGNTTAVNGHIYQDKNSEIIGNQIETRAKNLLSRGEREDYDYDDDYDDDYSYDYEYDDDDWEWSWSKRHYGSYSTLPISDVDDSFILRYNRVQGLFLGLGIPKEIGGKYNFMTVHGFAGYGFEDKNWRYQLGLDRWLFNQREYRFELGAKVYDLTDSRDEWLISTTENTLSSLLLKDDYHDFYRRTGYEVHMSQNFTIFLQGRLAYRNDDYESEEKNAKWALLNSKDKFRANPPIDDGNMRSIYGEIYLDTRDNIELPKDGWFGLLSMETSSSGLNSDFSFNQYVLELRRYQHFGYKERVDIRMKIGSAEGDLPLQKRFQLGGVSSLRGFSYKAFEGDRLFLTNIEYNLNPRVFSTDFLFFDELNYVVFYDIGYAWNSAEKDDNWYEGFDQLALSNVKSDIGLALTFNNGEYRVSFAKRLDTGKKPFNVLFRLIKPF